MLGIFCNWVCMYHYFFVYIFGKKFRNWELKFVDIYSVVKIFEMRRLPELAAWINQFSFRTGIRKNEEHEKTFFFEKKHTHFFLKSPTIYKKILMIHHKLCEIWRKKNFNGLRLTNHREWRQNIKVSSTFSEFLFN